jgi:hypothetical protein
VFHRDTLGERQVPFQICCFFVVVVGHSGRDDRSCIWWRKVMMRCLSSCSVQSRRRRLPSHGGSVERIKSSQPVRMVSQTSTRSVLCIQQRELAPRILTAAQSVHFSNASCWFRWRARGMAGILCKRSARHHGIVYCEQRSSGNRAAANYFRLLKLNLCTRCQRTIVKKNHSGEDWKLKLELSGLPIF